MQELGLSWAGQQQGDRLGSSAKAITVLQSSHNPEHSPVQHSLTFCPLNALNRAVHSAVICVSILQAFEKDFCFPEKRRKKGPEGTWWSRVGASDRGAAKTEGFGWAPVGVAVGRHSAAHRLGKAPPHLVLNQRKAFHLLVLGVMLFRAGFDSCYCNFVVLFWFTAVFTTIEAATNRGNLIKQRVNVSFTTQAEFWHPCLFHRAGCVNNIVSPEWLISVQLSGNSLKNAFLIYWW